MKSSWNRAPVTPSLRSRLLVLALCVSLLLIPPPARAQAGGRIGPSGGEVAGAVVGIAAGLVVIGFTVYYVTHRHAHLTGCTTAQTSGLALENEADHHPYTLLGDGITDLRPGTRLQVSGLRKKDPTGNRALLLNKPPRDLGPCTLPATTP